MKWHNYIVNVVLCSEAFRECIEGLRQLAGIIYSTRRDNFYHDFYRTFPVMRLIDTIFAFELIALSGFALYVRSQLEGLRKNAPKTLQALFIADICSGVIYMLIAAAATGVIPGPYVMQSCMLLIIIGFIMLLVNSIYYSNRIDLFVN